ncbi:MAG: hypothetical protein ACLFU1_04950 [Alphaproteobacteria bacterium]
MKTCGGAFGGAGEGCGESSHAFVQKLRERMRDQVISLKAACGGRSAKEQGERFLDDAQDYLGKVLDYIEDRDQLSPEDAAALINCADFIHAGVDHAARKLGLNPDALEALDTDSLVVRVNEAMGQIAKDLSACLPGEQAADFLDGRLKFPKDVRPGRQEFNSLGNGASFACTPGVV